MMLAYVDGRPIPNSSIFLTKLASEYLGGGSVKCCSSFNFKILISSPTFTSGNIFFASSSVS